MDNINHDDHVLELLFELVSLVASFVKCRTQSLEIDCIECTLFEIL